VLHAKPYIATILLAACAAVGIIALGPSVNAATADRLEARLGDKIIPLKDVSRYFCHDRGYPTIECFTVAGDRDADASRESYGALSSSFVVFYADEAYRGLNYEAWNAIPDLGSIGWNDMVSSFKSVNAGRPRWFSDSGYGYPSWRWAAGAWVSNVGAAANDKLSSVKNDP